MGKRRTKEQIRRLLREADQDLAPGLTVVDVCRKAGSSQTTYHRWRRLGDATTVDDGRRVRALETEVERLKLLVAELLLDKKMLQDVAKKSGNAQPATRRGGLAVPGVSGLPTPRERGAGPSTVHAAVHRQRP